MKLCQTCGQLVGEEIINCPLCGSEIGEGRKYIDDYRQYNYFVRVLRIVLYTDKDRFKAANQYYKLVTEDALRRFIYSFMLTASYYSDDPKDVIKGKERLEEIISDFDPEKLEVQKISWF